MATANTQTELSSCCGVRVTYFESTLVCKRCYGDVEWVSE